MIKNMPKITTQKMPAQEDWHSAFIIYQLRLKGLSLRRLSRQHKYSVSSAANALRLPWPKMERLIADALGVTPQSIWPTRYHEDGTPKSGRGERGLCTGAKYRGRARPNGSTAGAARNVNVKTAA